MNVAAVSAGVNGICSAISFAESGHNVSVFDSGKAFYETSSKSSKNEDFSKASRDSKVEKIGRLVSVFGGMLTSAMTLGSEVSLQMLDGQ